MDRTPCDGWRRFLDTPVLNRSWRRAERNVTHQSVNKKLDRSNRSAAYLQKKIESQNRWSGTIYSHHQALRGVGVLWFCPVYFPNRNNTKKLLKHDAISAIPHVNTRVIFLRITCLRDRHHMQVGSKTLSLSIRYFKFQRAPTEKPVHAPVRPAQNTPSLIHSCDIRITFNRSV